MLFLCGNGIARFDIIPRTQVQRKTCHLARDNYTAYLILHTNNRESTVQAIREILMKRNKDTYHFVGPELTA